MHICRRAIRKSKEFCTDYEKNEKIALQYNKKIFKRLLSDALLTIVILTAIIFIGVKIYDFLYEKSYGINANTINEILFVVVSSFCFLISGLLIICDFVTHSMTGHIFHIMGLILLSILWIICCHILHSNISEKSELFRNIVLVVDVIVICFTIFLYVMHRLKYLSFGLCISIIKARRKNKKIITLSICSECGQVDFDYSKLCSKCGSKNIRMFDEIYSEWNNQQESN